MTIVGAITHHPLRRRIKRPLTCSRFPGRLVLGVHAAVLVVSPLIRGWLSKAVRFRVNDLTVLSYSEIPDDQAVKVIHTVNAMNRN